MKLRAAAFASAALLAFAAPAAAQDDGERNRGGSYEEQISQLARILGRAHYLRITCRGRQDARWRTYVRHMIQQEPQHRGRIENAFNDGYLSEEARFPYCDRGAVQMESELRAEGMRIAQALSVRNAGDGVRREDD